jgi:NitT/TauT family transport system permease protein
MSRPGAESQGARPVAAGWGAALWPPVLALVAVLAVWEVVVRLVQPRKFVFCGPWDVAGAMWQYRAELVSASWTTLVAVLLGFTASALLGVLAGVLLAASRWLERAVYPFTVFLQTVPLVAIAPMLVLWLDAGTPAVATCAAIVCLFPVITSTLAGIRAIPRAQIELFWLYRASSWARLCKLTLPGALPSIMAGLRIASGLAVIGAVVGEFVAGHIGDDRGLGILIVVAAKQGEVPLLFAAVAAASLLGLLMLAAVGTCAYLLMHRWYDTPVAPLRR